MKKFNERTQKTYPTSINTDFVGTYITNEFVSKFGPFVSDIAPYLEFENSIYEFYCSSYVLTDELLKLMKNEDDSLYEACCKIRRYAEDLFNVIYKMNAYRTGEHVLAEAVFTCHNRISLVTDELFESDCYREELGKGVRNFASLINMKMGATICAFNSLNDDLDDYHFDDDEFEAYDIDDYPLFDEILL